MSKARTLADLGNGEVGDISSVTAGTGLSGGGTTGAVTVAIDTATTVDKTTVQTLTNKTIDYNSNTIINLPMPPRNAVLNSNFSVWQRGTSIALAASTGYANGYTADRWQTQTGANQAITVSRQTTSDTTNLPNIQYCARFQRNSGQTGTGTLNFTQSFETINSIPFVGKAVTISFYARAGANFSATSNALPVILNYGTGVDQNPYTYTGAAAVLSGTATLTTTWQRFTFTGTVPTTATELYLGCQYTPTGTAGAADYFEITGVQLELGSVANTYRPNGATYQAELAACQRYYQRLTSASGYTHLSTTASAASTTQYLCPIPVKATMRITPTVVDYSNLAIDTGASAIAVTAATINTTITPDTIEIVAVGVGFTQFRTGYLCSNNGAGYIGISAEL